MSYSILRNNVMGQPILQNNKESKITFPLLIFILVSVTSSFDVFLTFSVGGFTFRIAQFLLIFPIFLWFANTLRSGLIKLPLGSVSLVIWTMFILIFIPNTTFLGRNLGYSFWLIINLCMVFSIVRFINDLEKVLTLLKWYIYSFLFVSIFGLVQFFLGLVGIIPPFVTQWWIFGSLPRINGFSYEPSYFSTYLLIGWVFVFYIYYENIILISKKKLFVILVVITLAMILSSSRLGILLMGIWGIRYVFLFTKHLFKAQFHLKYFKILLLYMFVMIFLLGFVFFGGERTTFLLNGTGLNGTASHSVDNRFTDFVDTLYVFMNNPLIGVSLGGVAPAIGKLHGITVTDQETAKQFEGISIFAEVLAASGIIGFVPFIIYIFTIIFKPIILSKKIDNKLISGLLKGMVFSLICLLIILQFNQNILRLYLWLHIGILSALYSVSLKQLKNKID
jgi:hypothetical protein